MTAAPAQGSPPKGLFLRDRVAIVGGLVGVTALSWFYMWLLAAPMAGGYAAGGMAAMALCATRQAWTATDFTLTFVMWWVMMVGMMMPSAAPMLLTFATVNRRRRERAQPFVPTAIFAAGYLAAWGVFSLLATAAQGGLDWVSLLTPMMEVKSSVLGGSLLIAAGAFQFTPMKHACLDKCRSPLDLILNGWRDGKSGALTMGFTHGLYCLGCCWLLMLLMFVGGVMSLLWMAGLAVFVFSEKLLPGGERFARLSGVAMVGFGAYLLIQS